MSDEKDDDKQKEMTDWLKERDITFAPEGSEEYENRSKKVLARSDKLVTIDVIRPTEDDMPGHGVGLHVSWGDKFGTPESWDKSNLTPEQMFCLALMVRIQELLMEIGESNYAAKQREKRPNHLREVTQDNYADILAQMESIDKDQMN